MGNTVCQIVCDVVHIAPSPAFTGFDRTDNRVVRGMEVLGGVPVGRGVTTADVAAGEADS